MVRDRKNPYAPSATDGQDGSYARPPGKFTLTEALGSSGRSAVAPKQKPTAAGAGDQPENPDDPTDESQDVEAKEAREASPAPRAAAPQEPPPASPAPVAPAQKLPRLDLGRRGGKP